MVLWPRRRLKRDLRSGSFKPRMLPGICNILIKNNLMFPDAPSTSQCQHDRAAHLVAGARRHAACELKDFERPLPGRPSPPLIPLPPDTNLLHPATSQLSFGPVGREAAGWT
jgi:hypothetical protein